MKKTFILVLITALITLGALNLTSAQPLTYRGGNAMPAEMGAATFADYQPGDQVLGAYEYEGNLYASWIQPARATAFNIRAMADDGDSPVKVGVSPGEEPIYVLVRGDELTILNVDRVRGNWMTTFVLTYTGVGVEVYDNLYYTLCPEWPDVSEITLSATPATANLPFFRWLPYNQFLPNYYDNIAFELLTGSGRLTPSRTLNYWRYWFRPADIERGYIELKVRAVPLANCESDNLSRVVRVNFPKN
jgi:hypothetical protein